MTCPKCHGAMRQYERSGVTIDQCTECRGIFLDRGELEKLFDAEANWQKNQPVQAARPQQVPPPPPAGGYVPPPPPGGGHGQPVYPSHIPPPAPVTHGYPPPAPAYGHTGYHGHYRHQGHHGHYRHKKSFLHDLFD